MPSDLVEDKKELNGLISELNKLMKEFLVPERIIIMRSLIKGVKKHLVAMYSLIPEIFWDTLGPKGIVLPRRVGNPPEKIVKEVQSYWNSNFPKTMYLYEQDASITDKNGKHILTLGLYPPVNFNFREHLKVSELGWALSLPDRYLEQMKNQGHLWVGMTELAESEYLGHAEELDGIMCARIKMHPYSITDIEYCNKNKVAGVK